MPAEYSSCTTRILSLFIPDSAGPPFRCPEKNGFFADPEQCDKYYECVAEIPEEKFCPDGLLFDATDPNSELCDYPFNVDCGDREYVRKCSFPFLNLFPRYTTNNFLTLQRSLSQGSTPSATVPTASSTTRTQPCAPSTTTASTATHTPTTVPPLLSLTRLRCSSRPQHLVSLNSLNRNSLVGQFHLSVSLQGTCVREEQSSSFARKCEKTETKPNVEGFECPDGETIGPNGQPLAHPSFPHPTSCRYTMACSVLAQRIYLDL